MADGPVNKSQTTLDQDANFSQVCLRKEKTRKHLGSVLIDLVKLVAVRYNNCDFVVDLFFPAESAVRCECYYTAHRIVTSTSKRWKHNAFLKGFLRPHTHGSCVVGVTDRMSKQLQATTVHLENIENIMASYDDDSSVDTVF
jgi:hypothetical protein